MSRATVSSLHVGSNLVFRTCSLSIDPTSHITGVTVSHELFRMNPSEPFAPSYRGTISLIYPDQLSPLPFSHILHQCLQVLWIFSCVTISRFFSASRQAVFFCVTTSRFCSASRQTDFFCVTTDLTAKAEMATEFHACRGQPCQACM